MHDIISLDIAAAAKAIASKSVSSAELTGRTLERVELVESERAVVGEGVKINKCYSERE
jgi:hypothetical protein